MKDLLVIDTNWPINTRTQRFQGSLSKRFNVTVVAWRRDDEPLPEGDRDTYRILDTPIGYGNRLRKLLHLPKFIRYTFGTAQSLNPTILFASHWDSLICAVLIKKLKNPEIKIVYDCLDLPTSENKLLTRGLQKLERLLLRYVNVTVFASRHFKALYCPELSSLVFENYPSRHVLDSDVPTPQWLRDNRDLFSDMEKRVSWIGVVRYFDILDNILLAIKDTDIVFCVFGDGPDLSRLKARVIQLQLQDQVIFFGAYDPTALPHIYHVSTLVWAAYPTRDFNAIYAISNKYFECSYFSKSPILSQDTMMAKTLDKKNDSVVLVDEYDVDDIRMKMQSAFTRRDDKYEKYEPDILWEDKEDEFIEYLLAHL